jgi:hypothetical protein
MLARNSADAVKPPKVERKQMSVLDTDATADLIEAARETSLFVPILLRPWATVPARGASGASAATHPPRRLPPGAHANRDQG